VRTFKVGYPGSDIQLGSRESIFVIETEARETNPRGRHERRKVIEMGGKERRTGWCDRLKGLVGEARALSA
jgi:hypothetical protein